MILQFGKYKGVDVEHVFNSDRSYLDWLYKSWSEDNDPQWGDKNRERAKELLAVMNSLSSSDEFPAAQQAKEKMELNEKTDNASFSGILKKLEALDSITKKLEKLDVAITEITNEVAVIGWAVKGEKPPEKKVESPEDLGWD